MQLVENPHCQLWGIFYFNPWFIFIILMRILWNLIFFVSFSVVTAVVGDDDEDERPLLKCYQCSGVNNVCGDASDLGAETTWSLLINIDYWLVLLRFIISVRGYQRPALWLKVRHWHYLDWTSLLFYSRWQWGHHEDVWQGRRICS